MDDNEILENLNRYQNIVNDIINTSSTKSQSTSVNINTSTNTNSDENKIKTLIFNNYFPIIVLLSITVITYILYNLEPSFVVKETQISFKNGEKQSNVSILLCLFYSFIITLCGIFIFVLVKLNLKN